MEIERLFKLDFSLSGISTELNRHKFTISREITLRSSIDRKGCYGRNYNACIHRYNCDITNISKNESCKKKYKSCCFCNVCNDNCEYFKEDICEKLKSTPYVCNNCENRNRCTLRKSFYSAKTAQKDYEGLLVESRIGIESSPEEIKRLDNIIKPYISRAISSSYFSKQQR